MDTHPPPPYNPARFPDLIQRHLRFRLLNTHNLQHNSHLQILCSQTIIPRIHCKSIFCSQAIITPLHKKQNTESTTVEKDFHCNKIPAPPVVWERNILVQPEECNNHDKDDNADTFDYHSYYNTDIHKPRHHWHTDMG